MSPVIGTIAGTFITSLALLGGEASPGQAQFGMAAYFYAFTVSGAFGGVAMTGAAVIILRTGVFARWTGWVGLMAGTAAIVSIATLLQNDPAGSFAAINGFAWLAYFLWIAVLSVAMLRIPRSAI